jgi:hypothetical protein
MNQLQIERLRLQLGAALIFLYRAQSRYAFDADVQEAHAAVQEALRRLGPLDAFTD